MSSIENKKSTKGGVILCALVVLLTILIDQLVKYEIKTNFVLGEEKPIFGDWFILHFTENNGMAFGIEFGGNIGKYLLTSFRIIAVIGISWFIWGQIKTYASKLFIISMGLVLAGAIGNIIDSIFYGVWFEDINRYDGGWFRGRVVDMFYAPIINGHWPEWSPIWAGEEFIFFRPVFNVADAAISIGVGLIILNQKKFFGNNYNNDSTEIAEESNIEINRNQEV